MKQIIDGITYDTETAKLIHRGDHGESDFAHSDACWFLYQTQSGAFFVDNYGDSGEPEGITPLTRDSARDWLENNANHLVEQYFGPMPEAQLLPFNRRTVIAAINVFNKKMDHGDISEFLVNLSNELYKKIPGEGISKQKRLIQLKLLLDDRPHFVVDGEPLQKVIVAKAVSFVPEPSPWGSPPDENDPMEIFKRALAQDGFVVTEGALKRALPENVGLHDAEDEITMLLEKHGFATAREHMRQAYIGHTDGNWASANSQIRSFLESLFDELAVKLDPSAASIGGGHGRRAKLAGLGFLHRDLNEWSDDGKGYVNGLMNRLHPHGSHPGVSDDEDSTFRLHTVLIAARLFLRRFDKLVDP